MNLPPYLPTVDLAATTHLLVGMGCVLIVHVTAGSRSAQHPAPQIPRNYRSDILLLTALYLAATVATFIMSGKHAGGHWQHNLGQVLGNSTQAILVNNFANVYRTAVFGGLLYLKEIRKIRWTTFLIAGGSVALFDLALSFNRITIAYFALATFIAFRKQLWALLLFTIFAAPALGYATSFWAAFRGLALNDGFSLASAAKAYRISTSHLGGVQNTIDNMLNGMTEASNIVVFKTIVSMVPDQLRPLWGETSIVRPLTVLVPSTLWPEKPGVFGVMLGERLAGTKGLALNSTLFGEAFANFYFVWPAAFIVILLILNLIYSQLAKRAPIYGHFACFIAIASWRFDAAFPAIAIVALVTFEGMRWTLARAAASSARYFSAPAQPQARHTRSGYPIGSARSHRQIW